jgi:hypothetical protein
MEGTASVFCSLSGRLFDFSDEVIRGHLHLIKKITDLPVGKDITGIHQRQNFFEAANKKAGSP